MGLGISPRGISLSALCFGSGMGMEDISATVYGCLGDLKTSFLGPISTILPKYMMAIVLQK